VGVTWVIVTYLYLRILRAEVSRYLDKNMRVKKMGLCTLGVRSHRVALIQHNGKANAETIPENEDIESLTKKLNANALGT